MREAADVVSISGGVEVEARSVILAMGVSYRRLEVPALATTRGLGVHYGSSPSEARQFSGGSVFVVGGANSAGPAAVHLARYAADVTLLCRRSLSATMSQYLLDEIGGKENIHVREDRGGRCERHRAPRNGDATVAPTVRNGRGGCVVHPHRSGAANRVAAVRDPAGRARLSGWGLGELFDQRSRRLRDRWHVRAGSVKRVASAVGEGSVVIQHVHRYLESLEVRTHAG